MLKTLLKWKDKLSLLSNLPVRKIRVGEHRATSLNEKRHLQRPKDPQTNWATCFTLRKFCDHGDSAWWETKSKLVLSYIVPKWMSQDLHSCVSCSILKGTFECFLHVYHFIIVSCLTTYTHPDLIDLCMMNISFWEFVSVVECRMCRIHPISWIQMHSACNIKTKLRACVFYLHNYYPQLSQAVTVSSS